MMNRYRPRFPLITAEAESTRHTSRSVASEGPAASRMLAGTFGDEVLDPSINLRRLAAQATGLGAAEVLGKAGHGRHVDGNGLAGVVAQLQVVDEALPQGCHEHPPGLG